MELRIKDVLKERGMSQSELAGILGMTPPMLTKRLLGQNKCDLDFLGQVADVLEVPVAWLIVDKRFKAVSSFEADGKRFEVHEIKN